MFEDFTVFSFDLVKAHMYLCRLILISFYHESNLKKILTSIELSICFFFLIKKHIASYVINKSYFKNELFFYRDALFFFLLLIDLNKAGVLAQLALNSKNQDEVRANIARGMSLLGPTVTLDTLVEILLIGIGSLSGVRRLEVLCTYACLGVVVNYVVFMTFYPACLSLILEVR